MSRIPASLQAIFMASNKGEEVDKPPEDNSATKVFRPRRNWREQTKGWFFDPRQMCLQKSFERVRVLLSISVLRRSAPLPSY
jgi:hypothetical protein